jgi:hypothetical protein
MRDVTQTPPAIKIAAQRMRCTGCGAETNAVCTCGMNYEPVAERVAEYDAAHPGKSSRDAGTALGVSHTTVQEARRSGGNWFPPDTVTGRDGKQYPARQRQAAPEEPRYVPDRQADSTLALELIGIGYGALATKLQADAAATTRLNRVTKEMREQWDVTWF